MSTENLYSQEAIDKLKTMVDKIDIGMLCTKLQNSTYIHAVPMSRQEVDEQGNIWLICSSESEIHDNLQHSKDVSLLYADPSGFNFLSINGVAELSKDRARIEKYWSKMMEAWFEKGKEDPRIRILKFRPLEAHYWDNKANKLVTFLKVAASAVSGAKLDIGREGSLNI